MVNLQDILAVLSNVNYTDLPIIAIFIYNIIQFAIALYYRKTRFNRTIMFAYCIFMYAYGDNIQQYCKSNYKKLHFSKDYFDKQGIFLFIFFQLPAIISGIVLVIGLLTDYVNAYKRIYSKKNEKVDENKTEGKSKND